MGGSEGEGKCTRKPTKKEQGIDRLTPRYKTQGLIDKKKNGRGRKKNGIQEVGRRQKTLEREEERGDRGRGPSRLSTKNTADTRKASLGGGAAATAARLGIEVEAVNS